MLKIAMGEIMEPIKIMEKIIKDNLVHPDCFNCIVSYESNSIDEIFHIVWRDHLGGTHTESITTALFLRYQHYDETPSYEMIGSPELAKCSRLLWSI